MPNSAKTRRLSADQAAFEAAATCLRAGGLVAFPTETVYGLGADAQNALAVAKLYEAKGRPAFNPLIAHVESLAAAEALAIFNADAHRLARQFWPGPLTLVLRKQPGCPVSDLATAGLGTVALRVPDHPAAQAILKAFGGAVVAPSANCSGHVSPTTADHVMADLAGRIELVIDGGPTQIGLESTIIACLDEPVLLRPGGIAREDVEAVLQRPLASHPHAHDGHAAPDATNAPLAPGLLAQHYAPRAEVRLDARQVAPDEVLLAFGPDLPPGADRTKTLNLSPTSDLTEAAANLFGHLRHLDALGAARIAVAPIPAHGLGEAINDRLRRAAAPASLDAKVSAS